MSTTSLAPQVVLRPRRSAPLFGRHPWVLASSIARVKGDPADGQVVELVSDRGEWIGRGIYNGQSRIRVRLYTWQTDQPLDEVFWAARIDQALELRRLLEYDDPAGGARLVFSEADGLSGLVVDRYGADLVVQLTARAMAERMDVLLPLLVERCSPRSVHVRTDATVARAEGIEPAAGLVWGERTEDFATVEEGGVRFRVDLDEGQKTGFYLDQRENRSAAARLARGRRMLDMCCYTGGFALRAAKAGASDVLAVDTSRRAIEAAQANAALNNLSNVRFQTGDCFEVLASLAAGGEQFDLVVLDPPRFAGSRRQVDQALRAYHRLNRLALGVLPPGGLLVTCSCSSHVPREDFFSMLMATSQQSGREIELLEQRGAAPDHPVRVTCPETEYLKCFVCRAL